MRKKGGIPTTDLVSYSKMNEGSGQSLEDTHTTDNDLTLGSTTGVDTNDPAWTSGVLTFDGVDNYCTQEIIDIQQGTVRISTTNGQAFLYDTGQDFSPYVSVAGNNPYIAVVKDAGNDVAWGYCGDVSAGEALGDEKIQNGAFTSDTNNWTGGSAILASIIGGQSGNCLSITNSASLYGYAYQSFSTTAGKMYKITAYQKNGSHSALFWVGTSAGDNSILAMTMNNANWTLVTRYITATSATTYINIKINNNVLGNTTLVDEISCKEVTDVVIDQGLKLYSTKTGTTQNCKEVAAAFTANNTLTYEIRTSNFQSFTSGITVCGFVYGAAQDTKYVISKFDMGNTNRSWAFLSGTGATTAKGRVIISLDGNTTNVKDYTTSVDVFDSSYNFVAITYDNTTLNIYIDGVLDSSVTKTTDAAVASLFDSHNKIAFGAAMNNTAPTGYFAGKTRYGLIYSQALTQAQITNIYNATRKLMVADGLL